MSGRVTPATIAATKAGIGFVVHEYDRDPSGPMSYGLEAAEALGVEQSRVHKTLIADVAGIGFVVAVVPVNAMLDLKALAAAAGGKKADLADPALAERITGYVVGGISPLGQRRRLPTVVDADALAHATVFVSAGRRGLEIELPPADLVGLTGAATAIIAKRS